MTDEEVGIYIKALCHQYGEGIIEEDEYKTFPRRVKAKFIQCDGGYVNERLEYERERKERYKKNRMKNLEGKPLDERLRDAGVIK